MTRADSANASTLAARMGTLTIRRPDDWHVHLRDDDMLKAVLPFTVAQFARGIIMPNLVRPVRMVADAIAYRERILRALPPQTHFTPLITCYLTNNTQPDEIEAGHVDGVWVAAKLYPAGATTNAGHGVTDIPALSRVFERMEKIGMPLLVHGEATDPEVDVFDREGAFMDKSLLPLLKRHLGLKVVVEHVTTSETMDLVRHYAPRVAATITPHHLTINRTSMFQGGIHPHLYCLPIAKREHHRIALRKAATSGESCFFLGTDTAPHFRRAKEASCGCAGMFVAPTALQTYAQVFDEERALDRLEAFASLNGPRFYGVPPNEGTITLEKQPSRFPAWISVGNEEVAVFRGDEDLPWCLR